MLDPLVDPARLNLYIRLGELAQSGSTQSGSTQSLSPLSAVQLQQPNKSPKPVLRSSGVRFEPCSRRGSIAESQSHQGDFAVFGLQNRSLQFLVWSHCSILILL